MPAPQIKPLPYKRLKQVSPELDLEYWQELRALYRGGKYLLRNPHVFPKLFPQHHGETSAAYLERCRRAYYVNHLATVIDFIVAGLAQDPARLQAPGAEDGKETKVDDFWVDFEADCSPEGGEKVPFAKLLRDQVQVGLLLGRWWTLVDLPDMGPDFMPASAADQREAGALDAYAIALPPETVIDWHAGKGGELTWVMTRTCDESRLDPGDDRDKVRLEFRLYTATEWALYVVEYSKAGAAGGGKGEPGDQEMIAPSAVGTHSFGRVPVIGCQLPDGLWAGNLIHSLAVEYLNKSCGLSWAEYKSLYQSLYEFLGPEISGVDNTVSQAQQDPKRTDRRPRGPGVIQIRGNEDDAKFVGPDTSGFSHSLESLQQIRDDIYRVTHQMKLSQDTKGAMVRRSADSKKVDDRGATVVLESLGGIARSHGTEVADRVAVGRSEEPGWACEGMAQFESAELGEQLEQAVLLEGVSIPSATYQRRRKLRLVRADLGEEATEEVMALVEKELEQAITQDQLMMVGAMGEVGADGEPGGGPPGAGAPPAKGDPPPDDEAAPPRRKK